MPVPSLLKGLRPYLIAASAVAWFAAPSGGQDDNYPVRAEFNADSPDQAGRQKIIAVLTIKSGWRVHANPVGLKDLEESQVTLVVKNKDRFHHVEIVYPPGDIMKTPIGDFRVYRDKAVLQAIVERRAGDQEPLEITVFVRPVNDQRCLLPKRFKWTHP